jgi:hypothetical protein
LQGVGVEFMVPGAVSFKGSVSMTQPAPGVTRFDGEIDLNLIAISMEIDAQIVIGYDANVDSAFFAVYLAIELPAGIPLWATGLGLYGMAGLFAYKMEPRRAPDQAWYDIPPSQDWYHEAPVGVAQLTKWRNQADALAIGAGVTIGTEADNGFTFAARVLLTIVFPGPILLIEGRANLLKERATLSDEPMFRALAVLDFRAGQFLVGLDATYQYDDDGALIKIGGSAEAFFSLADPSAWHLYLGIDEPKERRIRAEIFSNLFEANTYFMLDQSSLKMGAWVGYDKDWSFGPAHVVLQAWMEGGAKLSFKPRYFQGSLDLHGNVQVSVCGVGVGLGVDAGVSAGVFDPMHIVATVSVKVDLPWPVPDFGYTLTLEWGPKPDPPALPVPLKDIAVEHLKVTTSWPLAAGELLLPAVPGNEAGMFDDQPPAPLPDAAPPPDEVPVVPLDARPHLTFGRPVHDVALVGVNPSLVNPNGSPTGWEYVGDPAVNTGPARVRISLAELRLDRWTGAVWSAVARKGSSANASGVKDLYGSWAPVPQLPSGNAAAGSSAPTANTKLWVWSISPFDYSRRTGGAWDEWFSTNFPDYPCVPMPKDRQVCCDASALAVGPAPMPPWTCAAVTDFQLTWDVNPRPQVVAINAVPNRAWSFAGTNAAQIMLSQAAKRIRIDVIPPAATAKFVCVDFAALPAGRARNPRVEAGIAFLVRDVALRPVAATEIAAAATTQGQLNGLRAGFRVDVALPTPCGAVRVTVSSFGSPLKLLAFDAQRNQIALAQQTAGHGEVEILTMQAPADSAIATVQVVAASNEAFVHSACYERMAPHQVQATTFDEANMALATYPASQGVIDIPASGVRRVVVAADAAGFRLVRVCVTFGLDAAEQIAREELIQHIRAELDRWQTEGEVLQPWTKYRLNVTTTVEVVALPPIDPGFSGTRTITQSAYFQTAGPPGLAAYSTPANHPSGAGAPAFASGLEDLTAYVAQTIPPTVPAAGEKPLLPRPVYRAYDVAVQFNETYVDEMYALVARDLSLYLVDNNDEPARDAHGMLLNPPNRWSRQDQATLSGSEQRWLAQLDNASCVELDDTTILPDQSLASGGQVLDAERLYDARLRPLLLHDVFDRYAVAATASGTGGTLADALTGGWTVLDVGAVDGPSRWTVREHGTPPTRSVEQTTNVSLGATARSDAFVGGSFLMPADHPHLDEADDDQPAKWSDVRVSAYVRSADDDVIGIGVRMTGASGYLLTLDLDLNRRRLIKINAGAGTVLAEISGGYARGVDTFLALEAVGSRLRAFVGGALLTDVTDERYETGRIALYSGQNAGTRFTDVRVDDLRRSGPTVYRFALTTSAFTDFRHHLHSYPDQTFVAAVADQLALAVAATLGIAPTDAAAAVAPTEAEARAYHAFTAAALGATRLETIDTVDVTRLDGQAQSLAFVVRTAEPLDWTRTTLEVSIASPQPIAPVAPGILKLVDASFATAANPNDESVTVLLREAADLTGWRIDRRVLPGPSVGQHADGDELFAQAAANGVEGPSAASVVWHPRFRDLGEVVLTAPHNGVGQPSWTATHGVLAQTASFRGHGKGFPGAHAVSHAGPWTDVRFVARVRSQAAGKLGVLFRYENESSFYRFAIELDAHVGRLVRRSAGGWTTLFVAPLTMTVKTDIDVLVDVAGTHITVTVNGRVFCDIVDGAHATGQVGFYTYGAPIASFSRVSVQVQPRVLGAWTLQDVNAAAQSHWSLIDGALHQTSVLPASDDAFFAVALLGEGWSDYRVDTDIMPTAAAVAGVVFRWQDRANHCRFVLDGSHNERRLVRVANGLASTLWSGAGPFAAGTPYRVRIETVGDEIRVRLDDQLLTTAVMAPVIGRVGALEESGGEVAWSKFRLAFAAPQWTAWYTFASEERLAAGRRMRALAGRASDPIAAPAAAGAEDRFQSTTAAAFAPQFRSPGIDLRLVGPDGTSAHARRFLAPSSYGNVAVRILRAADSTGFVLFVPDAGVAGCRLDRGEYRLRFRFARDNRTAVPGSLVLSQNGDTSTEDAVIDVPWSSLP